MGSPTSQCFAQLSPTRFKSDMSPLANSRGSIMRRPVRSLGRAVGRWMALPGIPSPALKRERFNLSLPKGGIDDTQLRAATPILWIYP